VHYGHFVEIVAFLLEAGNDAVSEFTNHGGRAQGKKKRLVELFARVSGRSGGEDKPVSQGHGKNGRLKKKGPEGCGVVGGCGISFKTRQLQDSGKGSGTGNQKNQTRGRRKQLVGLFNQNIILP